jgi:succinoglycan biosynthesis protein ExoW
VNIPSGPMSRISVIIPYYQTQKGVLKRALASVAAQTVVREIDLIIVDDGSPIPASEEVDGQALPINSCRILRQHNGGVGAARNCGLRAVASSTKFIAFLDSDDEWTNSHLERALRAFSAGADVYFSKTRIVADDDVDPDARWPTRKCLLGPVSGVDDLYFTTTDIALYALRCGLPVQSLVFRRSIAPSLLFPSDVRLAGEDLRFTFALVSATRRVAFSDRVEVLLGPGVNIYRSTVTHGAPRAIARLADELLSRLVIHSELKHDPEHEKLNKSLLNLTVGEFALQLLHATRQRRIRPVVVGISRLLRWPSVWPRFISAVARHIKAKIYA